MNVHTRRIVIEAGSVSLGRFLSKLPFLSTEAPHWAHHCPKSTPEHGIVVAQELCADGLRAKSAFLRSHGATCCVRLIRHALARHLKQERRKVLPLQPRDLRVCTINLAALCRKDGAGGLTPH